MDMVINSDFLTETQSSFFVSGQQARTNRKIWQGPSSFTMSASALAPDTTIPPNPQVLLSRSNCCKQR